MLAPESSARVLALQHTPTALLLPSDLVTAAIAFAAFGQPA
jgi:hypothetical protein